MIRVLLIQNITNPYRQVLFNAWAADGQQQGLELHVALMAHYEPYRQWQSKDYPLTCAHTFYRDYPLRLPGLYRMHLNPGIWRDLLARRWDIVIVAGYDHLTSAIAALLPKRSQIRLLWTESNAFSAKRTNWLSRRFKRHILRQYDGYIVPGQRAKDQVLSLWPQAGQRPFLRLPNVINFAAFAAQREIPAAEVERRRQKWGIPLGDRVILFVGQLDRRKAMDRFMAATADLPLRGLSYVLVGEGELADELAQTAAASKSITIKLLGYQKEEAVRELLGCCDAFVLPSLADPWPLVLIEAAAAGLPLLVSDRVGNHVDIVDAGRNGWLFDTTNPESIRAAVTEFSRISDEALLARRRHSAAIADQNFRTEDVLGALNRSLLVLSEHRTPPASPQLEPTLPPAGRPRPTPSQDSKLSRAPLRILAIQNITNPYRQVLFNAWAADCQQQGLELHVALMARYEPYRRWRSQDYPLVCPHKFYWDFPIRLPGFYRTHVNPGIWRDLLTQKWDVVVIAGYDHLTSAIAALLPKRSQIRLLWTESNAFSAKRTGWLSLRLKRCLLRRYDGFLVPGQRAKEQVLNLWPQGGRRPFLRLPNVINFPAFAAQRNTPAGEVARRRQKWGIPLEDRVILFVGRLDRLKAMDRFIAATLAMPLRGLSYVVVGEGELADELAQTAAASKAITIKLLGHQKEEAVREILGCSDAFVLPSLSDAWPLVIIEAAAAGLPLMVCDRVGNCVDIVERGRNGWVFDATDPANIRAMVTEFTQTSAEMLRAMGRRSAEIADQGFRTEEVLRALNQSLLALCADRAQGGSGEPTPPAMELLAKA